MSSFPRAFAKHTKNRMEATRLLLLKGWKKSSLRSRTALWREVGKHISRVVLSELRKKSSQCRFLGGVCKRWKSENNKIWRNATRCRQSAVCRKLTSRSSIKLAKNRTMNHFHVLKNNRSSARYSKNQVSHSSPLLPARNRPGLFDQFVLLSPTAAINNWPFLVYNLNHPHLNRILVNLASSARPQQPRHKQQRPAKVNEPLINLTPFVCLFLTMPPIRSSNTSTATANVNERMDYYRYL